VPNPSALTHIYHLLSLEEELRPLGDAVTLWTLNLDDSDLGLRGRRDRAKPLMAKGLK